METGIRSHQGELFVHPLSNPGAVGICPEMLEVAEEANRAGDFNLAVEIYSSQLADLQQTDRGLCLRKADCLCRAGRISEALDSYCTAANLGKLRPEELSLLVETIARTLCEKELGIPWRLTGHGHSSSGEDGVESDGECEEDETLDLFSCRLCKCLLHEPTTVECGHTFCKRCLENNSVKECIHCKQQLNKKDGLLNERRLNVVLSSLLDKLFATESKSRKFWIEGEVLWKNQNLSDALEKYNAAVELELEYGEDRGTGHNIFSRQNISEVTDWFQCVVKSFQDIHFLPGQGQAAPSVVRQDVSDRLALLGDELHHCQFGAPARCKVLPMDG